MQLIIDTYKTTIDVYNKCFLITKEDTKRIIAPKRVTSIRISNNSISIKTAVFILAANYNIPIYITSFKSGEWSQSLSNSIFTQVDTLKSQIINLENAKGFQYTLNLIIWKIEGQARNVKKWNNLFGTSEIKYLDFIEKCDKAIATLKEYTVKGTPLTDRNIIMGVEGRIAKDYFSIISQLLPEEYAFKKRTKRPSKDIFSSGLNFLYSYGYQQILAGILAAGLNPYIGYLHANGRNRKALSFDLIEPLRPVIDNVWVHYLCTNKPHSNKFNKTKRAVYLGKEVRKEITSLWFQTLKKRVKIGNNTYSLEKHIYIIPKLLKDKLSECI